MTLRTTLRLYLREDGVARADERLTVHVGIDGGAFSRAQEFDAGLLVGGQRKRLQEALFHGKPFLDAALRLRRPRGALFPSFTRLLEPFDFRLNLR